MLINDLKSGLPSRSFMEFQGNDQLRIRGLGLNPRRRGVRGCLYVLPEPSWHSRYPRIYRRGKSDEAEIRDALDNGAVGLVLPIRHRYSQLAEGVPCFFVNDTLDFLYRAGEVFRRSLTNQTLTAITGSAGKSTMKRMILHALEAADPERKAQKVSNNRNLSSEMLWQLSWAPLYGHTVIEQDGGSFRQLREYQFSLSPDVAIVTSIAEAHMTFHGDLEQLVQTKSDIMMNPPAGGSAVINIDTLLADRLVERAEREGARLITYGESAHATIRLDSYDPATGEVVADVNGERLKYTVGARGMHIAVNSLGVIATLIALGIKEWEAGIKALSSFEPLPGRGQIMTAKLPDGGSIRITDESHNANPASMKATLHAFAHTPISIPGRRIAILGDMRELGQTSTLSHQNLSEIEGLESLDQLHLIGDQMRVLYDALKDTCKGVHHWDNTQELITGTGTTFQNGDAILVKASAGVGLKHFIGHLINTK